MKEVAPISRQSASAFTLIELLVVITIIGVLVALLLPAVQSSREAARQFSCKNRLKQQATAMQAYHAQQGSFPAGGREHELANRDGVSWRVDLLPYVEEQSLFDSIGVLPSGGASNWLDARGAMPLLFECPSEEAQPRGSGILNRSSYYGVAGARRPREGQTLEQAACGDLFENGIYYLGSLTRVADVLDGTSNTLALGERTYVFANWMAGGRWSGSPKFKVCSSASGQVVYPINADNWEYGFYVGHNPLPDGGERKMLGNNLPYGSRHPGGAHFAMADSAVRFISDDLDLILLENLSTIAGTEVNDPL